jgi:chemotaxis signal transduction protein
VEEVLVCCVGRSEWTLPAQKVRQVISPRHVTRVPGSVPPLVGLIAWRASLVPVLALGARAETGRLLVIEDGGELFALLVDEVKGFRPVHVPSDGQEEQGSIPPPLDLERVLDGR